MKSVEGAGRRLLLVEGKDDLHVFRHLLQHLALEFKVDVEDSDGLDPLLKRLPVQVKESDLIQLGVVVDADLDIGARWQSLRHVLQNDCGYSQVPAKPHKGGTIIEHSDKPKLGVWLMPDNTLPGMLEDFIGFLVPSDDSLWPVAQTTVDGLPAAESRFHPEHRPKALIHTWLAWQREPGTPLGLAISKQYLDVNSPRAGALFAWLQGVFVA